MEDVVKRFRKLVNMSPSEIRSWAKDPVSKDASFESTRRRLPALAKLKAKPESRWTAKDEKFAKRVVGFNSRMRGMLKKHGCKHKIVVSLMNWGHRPPGCAIPR